MGLAIFPAANRSDAPTFIIAYRLKINTTADKFFEEFYCGCWQENLVLPTLRSNRGGFFIDNHLIYKHMVKYITSDKVGQFVQALYESGKFYNIQVDGNQVAVNKAPGADYLFIQIVQKNSYEQLLKDVIEEA